MRWNMDYSNVIQESIEYIEDNLDKKIKIEDVAKKFYFSTFYFHRLFHRLTGENVAEYIRKRKMSKAAEDLIETDMKIVEIAVKYQYSSQEAFSRSFKSFYGIKPNEFRKKHKNLISYNKVEHVIKAVPVQTQISKPTCSAA
jgi:AraC family transcriptional regulator